MRRPRETGNRIYLAASARRKERFGKATNRALKIQQPPQGTMITLTSTGLGTMWMDGPKSLTNEHISFLIPSPLLQTEPQPDHQPKAHQTHQELSGNCEEREEARGGLTPVTSSINRSLRLSDSCPTSIPTYPWTAH